MKGIYVIIPVWGERYTRAHVEAGKQAVVTQCFGVVEDESHNLMR